MRPASTIAPHLAACALACVACTDPDSGPSLCDGGDAHVEDTSTGDAGDATTSADSAPADGALAETSTSARAYLRVANWSPDAPAVDFCIAPHGTSAYQGPLAGALAASAEASSQALSFPSVSAYVGLAPGAYDVRVVAFGAATCGVGIGNDLTTLPALAPNTFGTVALLGENVPNGGDPGLSVVGFVDGATTTGGVSLRFVNASPGLASATLGTGALSNKSFKALFSGVAFGTASTSAEAQKPDAATVPVDAHGYLLNQTLSGVTLSAHAAAATADAVVTSNLSVAAGADVTIVLVGGTSSGVPARLLECADNAGSAGEFSDCMLLP
jgi:hypothetical protein